MKPKGREGYSQGMTAQAEEGGNTPHLNSDGLTQTEAQDIMGQAAAKVARPHSGALPAKKLQALLSALT